MAVEVARQSKDGVYWCVRLTNGKRFLIKERNDSTRCVYKDNGAEANANQSQNVLAQWDAYKGDGENEQRVVILEEVLPANDNGA